MIFCEICHTKFKCINGEYICQEGHISQTKLEIADDIHVSSRSQKQKIKINLEFNYCFNYKKLLLYKLIFIEVLNYFNCSSTKYFDYLLNFYNGNRDNVDLIIDLNYTHLIILVYLTLREKQNIFFIKVINQFKNFKLLDRANYYKKILNLKNCADAKLGLSMKKFRLINIYRILKQLGEPNYFLKKYKKKIILKAYICSPLIEYNKQFFRQFVPETNEFFEKVLFVLCIKKTEKVEKYFKKYIKLRDLNSTIFVPEEEICKYLYLFNQHEKLVIDFKQANINLKNFEKKIIKSSEETKCNSLIDLICLFCKISESRFNKNIRETISKPAFGSKNIFSVPCYEYGLQNDFYYSNFCYIDKLKKILQNKMNWKIKKSYIEDDRI